MSAKLASTIGAIAAPIAATIAPVARQTKFGQVIGTKMQKTIKVRIENISIHPIVQKPVRTHKNFLVHDEEETCVVGDYVKIVKCNKLSKKKYFKLSEIIKPAQRFIDADGVLHTQAAEVKKDPKEYNMENYV
jgi:ribosomal protein S17